MYAARSIFAKQSLLCGSKNTFLADLPPGSVTDARGKSVWGVPQGGHKAPLRNDAGGASGFPDRRPFPYHPVREGPYVYESDQPGRQFQKNLE